MTAKRRSAQPALEGRPVTRREPGLPAPHVAGGLAAILLLYAFVALYLIPIFPHGGSANEETRWATAASLVEHGTFEISGTESLIGPIVDTARVGDRIYSNKAPGTVVLAMPGYLLVRPFTGPPDASNIRVSWTFMRWLVATLPLLLFAYTLARRGADPIVVFVALFATPLFLYSLLLFSHVLAGVAIYGAYRLLFRSLEGPTGREALAAGLLAGTAVGAEFIAAVVVIVLGAGVMLAASRPIRARSSTLLWFVLGGVPWALAIALYNATVFGSPLELASAHENFKEWADLAAKGVFGIGAPDPRNFWLLLLSPSRGLFFYAPVLILAAIGMARVSGADSLRKTVRAASILVGIVVMSGHGAAHGGWAAGPRYLVFLMPLLVEPLVEIRPERLRGAGAGVLLGASLALNALPALTFPFAPPEFLFPHNSFWRPLLVSEGWATPTLGALLGLGSELPALVPVLAAAFAALALALRRSSGLLVGGVALGLAIAMVYAALPGLDSEDLAMRRASIAERFFRPAGRLEPFRARASDQRRIRFLESMEWQIADVRALAPSNWPYGYEPLLAEGPTALANRAAKLQGSGRLSEAETLLRNGRETFAFARCEMSDSLGVVLYLAGRKDEALVELESVRPSVARSTRSGCWMTLFHLASLYQERGRSEDSAAAFQEFLRVTEGSQESKILSNREIARKALQTFSRAPHDRR